MTNLNFYKKYKYVYISPFCTLISKWHVEDIEDIEEDLVDGLLD